jgi:hypothetical protein
MGMHRYVTRHLFFDCCQREEPVPWKCSVHFDVAPRLYMYVFTDEQCRSDLEEMDMCHGRHHATAVETKNKGATI